LLLILVFLLRQKSHCRCARPFSLRRSDGVQFLH